MNIVRTKAVELTAIPAIAYKQKLKTGGAGITIMRLDKDAKAVATLDKRSGEPVPYGTFDESLFPPEAFDEALDLASGLPYAAMSKLRINIAAQTDQEDIECETPECAAPEPRMCGSDEYLALVDRYSDENGKMNFTLMNKEFMNFAQKSKVVADMAGAGAQADDIVIFVIKNRAAFFAGKKEHLNDSEAALLIDTLNEINPRSAFKDLKAYVIRLLSKGKRK
ncbi:MAG: hypothetical protein FWE91_00165 [Defluviitaleaceae bacterium]|nr:hypothetical protein [Defluviitaleaceae bacterium]MCL2836500.1 hypothetical protein [Defluviitaleaceae bacterium]